MHESRVYVLHRLLPRHTKQTIHRRPYTEHQGREPERVYGICQGGVSHFIRELHGCRGDSGEECRYRTEVQQVLACVFLCESDGRHTCQTRLGLFDEDEDSRKRDETNLSL